MATTPAVGPGPISYLKSDGTQVIIPLTALGFSGGSLTIPTSFAEATTWLTYLAQQGILTLGAPPPPAPAINIKAATPGSGGNNIRILIANVDTTQDPAKFDVTITETEVYTGLSWDSKSPMFIATILGTHANPGSGLVHVKDNTVSGPPNPIATPTPLTLGSNGKTPVPATYHVTGTSGDAFVLEARSAGTGGNSIKVTITNVDTTTKTFTLTAAWMLQLTGTNKTTASDLANNTDAQWEITVTQPTGGYLAPAPGAATLSGGTDGLSPTAATATILANQS